ncbi:MAG: UDP-3-O-(3-hydroxymyristoyl)glucosamine N-acyltransferase [Tepidisphaeraceae bacterium]
MPTLGEIASLLGVPLQPVSETGRAIAGVAALEEASTTDLSFLGSDQFLKQFEVTRAAAVIVDRRVKLPAMNTGAGSRAAVLVVDDAELAIARVLELFAPPVSRPPVGIDAAARVDLSARIGEGCAVGPFVVVGRNARVGHGCVLHAGVFIGDDVTIGDKSEIFPGVVVRERITIGSRVVIHAGSVLGTDGFGYHWDGQRHAKIPQIGTIVVEDDVEIGSCVCVDRAKFSTTRIGRGTKIDNLVQIGHNVQIGAHCIIVGQAGLAGSVKLGAGVVLGGQCAVRDHTVLADGAMVAACSGVMKDVEPKMIVSGLPALPHRQSLREQAALRHLPELREQVKRLQEELESLKKRL